MACIYKEGTGYAARVRRNGRSAYKAGFKSHAAVEAWVRETEIAFLGTHQRMKGFGPMGTTLAVALRQYAEDFTATKRGAKQEATRLNPYFAAVGMSTLRAVEIEDAPDSPQRPQSEPVFRFEELPPTGAKLPRTFGEYRQRRLGKRPHTAEARATLAAMHVGRIAPHHISSLVTAMKKDRLSSATINNELSLLSSFFNQARKNWLWEPLPNPLDNIAREKVDNARNRVLSAKEEGALAKALDECNNPYIAPFVWLSVETAMRKSESLLWAHWEDIDWTRRVLRLRRGKCGKREVPLSKAAIQLLETMPGRTDGGKIFKTTADAIDSAWERACQRAGITNLRIHDLRHTAATRHARRLDGNIFLLKLITGHKTLSMLSRYVNPTVDDAVKALDETEPPNPGERDMPPPASSSGFGDLHEPSEEGAVTGASRNHHPVSTLKPQPQEATERAFFSTCATGAAAHDETRAPGESPSMPEPDSSMTSTDTAGSNVVIVDFRQRRRSA